MARSGILHTLRYAEWTRPFWWIVAVPFAAVMSLICAAVWLTARIRFTGAGAGFKGAAIYVNWHRHLPLTMVAHGRARRWMMMLGAPYMAPIAAWSRCLGLRLIRGATGSGGREALEKLREPLARGESVVLAVDGPGGPAFVVKPGCVELARVTGAPIIPVAYRSRHQHTVESRWDRMLVVLPFDDIELLYGAPIRLDERSGEEALLQVRDGLRALDAIES